MPDNQWIKVSDNDANGRFSFSYTADKANSATNWMILNTKDRFVDKNIFVQAIVPAGSLAAGSTTITVTSGNAGSLLTEVQSQPTNGPYLTVQGSGVVTIGTPGWIDSTTSATSTSATKYYSIATGTYSADDDSSTRINGTVTPSIGLNSNAANYGLTTTTPSGTNGTNYLTIDPSATVTQNWSITPRANITAAGYIAAGNTSGTAISGAPTIANGENYYIPIVTTTVSGGTLNSSGFTKNDLAITFAAGRNTSTYRNMTNATVGAKDTTNYKYFFEINGTTPDISGTTSVTRSAITYSNNAGAIAENINTQAIAGDSISPTVSITGADNNTYFNLKAAAASVSASVAKPTIEKVTSAVTGKTQIFSDITWVNTNQASSINTYYIAVKGFSGAVTQGTPTIGTKGYLDESSQITANGVAAKAQSDIYYLPVPTATFSTSGDSVTVNTAGYAYAGQTVTTVSAASLANAPDTANSKTHSDYTDISNVAGTPVLTSGSGLYINAGYIGDTYISLAHLVPDVATIVGTNGESTSILSGVTVYDANGALIAGTMQTYAGSFSVT